MKTGTFIETQSTMPGGSAMPSPKFAAMTHLITIAPGDGDVESIHCNKMRPRPAVNSTRTPDEVTCPQCMKRLIREALNHAASRK